MSASAVLPKLAALYASEPQTVPLYARLSVHIGQEAELFMTDGTFSVTAHGPAAERAKTQPITEASALKAIGQTGGTPYYIDHAEFDMDADAILPVSALKAMRREAIASIAAQRVAREPYKNTGAAPAQPLPARRARRARAAAQVR